MNFESIIGSAVQEGFAAASIVDTSQIPFDPIFQTYCQENLCGKYGANYACPPACGTPEEMRLRIVAHKHALVLQTIWEIDGYGDSAAIKEAKKKHNAASLRLMKKLRSAGCDGFLAGASGCSLCDPCAMAEGLPCRFPDLRYSCLSAYCVFVKKLADRCGMEYDCGPGLLAFFGLYVFD